MHASDPTTWSVLPVQSVHIRRYYLITKDVAVIRLKQASACQ